MAVLMVVAVLEILEVLERLAQSELSGPVQPVAFLQPVREINNELVH
jgi:hypothetical protein